jgi:osmoprotectant transport system permease protein
VAYGLELGESRSLLQAVKHTRRSGPGGWTSSTPTPPTGFLAGREVVVLEDDLGFFPPYEAAPLVGARLLENPGAVAALTELAGNWTRTMRD